MNERLRNAILTMWEHRHDVDPHLLPPEIRLSGPVMVEAGELTIAHDEVITESGSDEPLPEQPGHFENVINLDEHRIRADEEFEGEAMAYVEALWGKETHSFNAAVRDLEAMRRGTEDPSKPLRPPETYHEAIHIILHVRALANDLARHFGIHHVVRPEDDLAVSRKK